MNDDKFKEIDSLLEKLKSAIPDSNIFIVKKDAGTYSEIFEKAQPMPVYIYEESEGDDSFWPMEKPGCPRCGEVAYDGDYCKHCGQRLDRSGKR